MTAPNLPRILVDPEIFRSGRCGMTRYYATLCDGLRAIGHQVVLPLYLSGSDFMQGRFGLLRPTGGPLLRSLPARAINRAANQAAKARYYRALRERAADVALVTSPVFEDRFLSHVGTMPWMMVVHDTMRCVLGPDGLFDPAGSNADRLAFLARRASQAICISEATRQDLLRLSGLDPARATLIHTGCLLNADQARPVAGLPERYLLFVGERSGRKNFRAFITAIAPLLHRDRGLHLVCTGDLNTWERDLLDHLDVTAQVIAIAAPDPVLVTLYRQALGLVYPSLYEGFGLPLVEAMRLGCPIITANTSAMPEIAGDAALYVDPLDGNTIAAAVETLITDADRRHALAAAGLARAARFDRQKMLRSFSEEFCHVVRGR